MTSTPRIFANTVPDQDNKTAQFLATTPLFLNADADILRVVANHVETLRVAKNKSVWQAGDSADSLYIIRTGVVREFVVGTDDRDVTLGILGRTATIGLAATLPGNFRNTTAVAHEGVTLFALSTPLLNALTRQYPSLSDSLTGVLVQHLQRSQIQFPTIINLSAQARLAGVLLALSQSFGIVDSRGTIINIKLTHRIIATMTGTTRETVSFAIMDLRNSGVLTNDGKRFIIVDIEHLRALSLG